MHVVSCTNCHIVIMRRPNPNATMRRPIPNASRCCLDHRPGSAFLAKPRLYLLLTKSKRHHAKANSKRIMVLFGLPSRLCFFGEAKTIHALNWVAASINVSQLSSVTLHASTSISKVFQIRHVIFTITNIWYIYIYIYNPLKLGIANSKPRRNIYIYIYI